MIPPVQASLCLIFQFATQVFPTYTREGATSFHHRWLWLLWNIVHPLGCRAQAATVKAWVSTEPNAFWDVLKTFRILWFSAWNSPIISGISLSNSYISVAWILFTSSSRIQLFVLYRKANIFRKVLKFCSLISLRKKKKISSQTCSNQESSWIDCYRKKTPKVSFPFLWQWRALYHLKYIFACFVG